LELDVATKTFQRFAEYAALFRAAEASARTSPHLVAECRSLEKLDGVQLFRFAPPQGATLTGSAGRQILAQALRRLPGRYVQYA